jgi:TP901 family phage tail tape measure protein
MAFTLTAQLKLQNPTNLNQIINQIKGQLSGVNLNINVKNSRDLQNLNSQLVDVNQNAKRGSASMFEFGKQASTAAKRFFAFSVATTSFIKLIGAIQSGIADAIEFEREVFKIAQVTGTAVRDMKDLTDEVTRLGTSLGVSSTKILSVAQVLAQAGLSAEDTKKSLDALAKSDLSPTFDNMANTAEGAIAIFAQFGVTADQLEAKLGSINSVSAKFAVESSDLITTVRRTGGAFKAAGGSLEELIALFTSVRATTRESAESIATGFRTIFTRLQRISTVNFLEGIGIQLRDFEGQFVGPYEAIRRLSGALKEIPSTDPRFSKIIEELGGFRQVSKVIPLIQKFSDAEKALVVAQQGQGSLARDAAQAQGSLAVKIAKVREEFEALIRKIAGNESFTKFTNAAIAMASALIKVADAAVPLLPFISALGALKFGSALPSLLKGFTSKGGLGFHEGGEVHKFAGGGLVPGKGNSDTVKARLQAGEFVMRKKAVENIGVGNLADMNSGRKYATGGTVEELDDNEKQKLIEFIKINGGGSRNTANNREAKEALKAVNIIDTDRYSGKILSDLIISADPSRLIGKTLANNLGNKAKSLAKKNNQEEIVATLKSQMSAGDDVFGAIYLNPVGKRDELISKIGLDYNGEKIPFPITYKEASISEPASTKFKDRFASEMPKIVQGLASDIASDFKSPIAPKLLGRIPGQESIAGSLFEGALFSLGAPYQEPKNAKEDQRNFDFPNGLGNLSDIFGSNDLKNRPVDAKLTFGTQDQSLRDKANEYLSTKYKKLLNTPPQEANLGGIIQKFAKGGDVDTVPALLTPGEFVFTKDAAQRIGYNNLNRMNKGVQKFAKGGLVQHFNTGGTPSLSSKINSFGTDANIIGLLFGLNTLAASFGDMNSAVSEVVGGLTSLGTRFATINSLVSQFGKAFPTKEKIKEGLDAKFKQDVVDRKNNITGTKSRASTNLRFAKARIQAQNDYDNTSVDITSLTPDQKRLIDDERTKTQKELQAKSISAKLALRRLKNSGVDPRSESYQQADQKVADTSAEYRNYKNTVINPDVATFKQFQNAASQDAINKDPDIQKKQARVKQLESGLKSIDNKIASTDPQNVKAIARLETAKLKVEANILKEQTEQLAIEKKITQQTKATLATSRGNDSKTKALNTAIAQEKELQVAQLKNAPKPPTEADIAAKQKSNERLQAGIVSAIAIGGVVGEAVTSRNNKAIQQGGGSTGAAAAGGFLSGAAGGGAAGFALGGPYGAAVGALVGATYGAVTAFQEAEQSIAKVKFDKTFESFNKKLNRNDASISDINTFSSTANVRLLTTSGDDYTTALGQVEGSAVQLDAKFKEFVGTLAKSSGSSEEILEKFNKAVKPETIELFAKSTGRTATEVKEDFKKLSESTFKTIQAQNQLATVTHRIAERMSQLENIISGFSRSNFALDEFSAKIDEISNFSITSRQSKLGAAIASPLSFNQTEIQSELSNVLTSLGSAGTKLKTDFNTTYDIIQKIPQVLSTVESGNLENPKDVIIKAFGPLPDAIRDILDSTLSSLTGNNDDPKGITDKLQNDFQGLSKTLQEALKTGSGFNAVQAALDNYNKAQQVQTAGLNKLSELHKQQIDLFVRAIDIEDQFINNLNDLGYKVNQIGPSSDTKRQQAILGTSSNLINNPTGLGQSAISSFLNLQAERNNPNSDPFDQSNFSNSLATAVQGLEYLANYSARAAEPLKKISELRNKRSEAQGFVASTFGGGTTSLRETNKNLRLLDIAQQGQISQVSPQNQIQLLQFLQSNREASVATLGGEGNFQAFISEVSKNLLTGPGAILDGGQGTASNKFLQEQIKNLGNLPVEQQQLKELNAIAQQSTEAVKQLQALNNVQSQSTAVQTNFAVPIANAQADITRGKTNTEIAFQEASQAAIKYNQTFDQARIVQRLNDLSGGKASDVIAAQQAGTLKDVKSQQALQSEKSLTEQELNRFNKAGPRLNAPSRYYGPNITPAFLQDKIKLSSEDEARSLASRRLKNLGGTDSNVDEFIKKLKLDGGNILVKDSGDNITGARYDNFVNAVDEQYDAFLQNKLKSTNDALTQSPSYATPALAANRDEAIKLAKQVLPGTDPSLIGSKLAEAEAAAKQANAKYQQEQQLLAGYQSIYNNLIQQQQHLTSNVQHLAQTVANMPTTLNHNVNIPQVNVVINGNQAFAQIQPFIQQQIDIAINQTIQRVNAGLGSQVVK